jgi:hypothetical protein
MSDTQPVESQEPAVEQGPPGPTESTMHFSERERIHFYPDAGAAWEVTRTAKTDGFINCLCMGDTVLNVQGSVKTPDGIVHPLARVSRVGDVPDMVVSFTMPVRQGDQWSVAGVRAGMEDATREVVVYWTPLVHHEPHD